MRIHPQKLSHPPLASEKLLAASFHSSNTHILSNLPLFVPANHENEQLHKKHPRVAGEFLYFQTTPLCAAQILYALQAREK
jgi:hypothetical protein